MKNVVLIGMPGCGKTTIGKLVAQQLRFPFLDTDLLCEEYAGKSIPDIFAQDGENVFRNYETRAAIHCAKQRGVVISTGGGLILRPQNMEALQENGIIFFLDRPPEDISENELDGRPLLVGRRKEKFYMLYDQRISLYREYGTYWIDCGNRTQHSVGEILSIYDTVCSWNNEEESAEESLECGKPAK